MIVAGFHVAHVDAAKPNVQAARIAAQHNRRGDAPIRYLVDDAAKFAARELRRGRKYHTIVLDPPAYGHAPGGKAWRLERDLWPLLENCLALLDPDHFRLLITGHSPQVGAQEVTRFLEQSPFLRRRQATSGLLLEPGRSQLRDKVGRALDAGFFVRAQSRPSGAPAPTLGSTAR
jgi:23S rRNA (cytosine1962-C5)-methyltransferase